MRTRLSNQYIRGSGIEIGGLHNPLPVLPGALVRYMDRMSLADLERTSDVTPVKNSIIVDDAETLQTIPDQSLDFVIANHVLEHCHDPIGTIKTWRRVLKEDGIIYAAIPEMTHTFDKERMITTLDHLILDHREGPELRDREHYREWFFIIDKMRDDALEQHVEFCFNNKTNIHFHCWRKKEMQDLFYYLSPIVDIMEMGDNGAEVIWILKRK